MNTGLSLREYGEFSEIELLMSKFIMKMMWFDIGSNIGAFTVPFAKS